MKAIHNAKECIKLEKITVFNTSKIQNESNSQHTAHERAGFTYCFQYFKDTK